MRIVSDFKDYYDSALSFGFDPDVRYLRKKEVFEFFASSDEKKRNMPGDLDEALRIPLEFVRRLPCCFKHTAGYQTQILPMPITA